MSPVSIMYSLRSYNAGEVGEGVLRESRVAVYGRVWAEGLRGVRCTRHESSIHEPSYRALTAAVGRQWRPPNGPRPGPSRATLSVTRYISAAASNHTH